MTTLCVMRLSIESHRYPDQDKTDKEYIMFPS